MIDLEGLAHWLANAMFGDSDLEETEKAKIEYGFSLTIGIGLTFILSMVPAVFLGTIFYTLLIMVSALGVRLFSGGGHCTSYARCLLLSLLIFVPGGAFVKLLAVYAPLWLIALICSCLLLAPLTCYFCKQGRFSLPPALLSAVALALCFHLKGKILTEIILPAAMGIFIQTFMTTGLGEKFVEKTDFWLKQIIK